MRGRIVKSRGGINHKQVVLRVHLVPHLGAKKLDAITNEDVQRLKHILRAKAPRTVNNVLTVLSMLLKVAVEWKVIDGLPCRVRLLKVPEGAIDFYDFAEYEAMIVAASRQSSKAAVAVLLGGDAGLRGGEMRALEWTDVNFKTNKICVARNDWQGHVTATKGNRVRYVPMTARLRRQLQAHRHLQGKRVLCRADGKPLAEHHLVDLLAAAARRANLRNNGPHILRHTFCSHLAMRGANPTWIQRVAGHKDLATTQKYMHLSPEISDEAIKLLEAPRPFPVGDMLETATVESPSR